MTSLTLTPRGPLSGICAVPGDKSITHRAIILSALAEGDSTIQGDGRGDDCRRTAQAFRALGIAIQEDPDALRVTGKGLWGLRESSEPIDCGNSGTGIRLLAGLLAGQDFFTVLTGDTSVRRRPMGRVVKPLREMGAHITGRKGGELAPLAITGTRLHGIHYASPVASAQVKSSLLLAGLFADGTTRITEPRPSRDHTERMFQALGLPLRREGLAVELHGRPKTGWTGRTWIVPGDFSAAAFFLVGATIVPESALLITNVGINPTRTGLLDLLRDMGASIELVNRREACGEPVADLRVQSAALRGVDVRPERIPGAIDEFPILCVAAALAEGETRIRGAEELRVKESDRIATMACELKKMGVGVTERPDGLVIQGCGWSGRDAKGRRGFPLRGASCPSYGDHRVAMALAIAALVAEGPTQISDTACIETSFPGFSDKLLELLTKNSGPL